MCIIYPSFYSDLLEYNEYRGWTLNHVKTPLNSKFGPILPMISIPASSNVCKIITFSGICCGRHCSASEQFCILVILHVFPGFETAKKTQRNGEKNPRNGETNQEPKMWKLKRRKFRQLANKNCCFEFRVIILRWNIPGMSYCGILRLTPHVDIFYARHMVMTAPVIFPRSSPSLKKLASS